MFFYIAHLTFDNAMINMQIKVTFSECERNLSNAIMKIEISV